MEKNNKTVILLSVDFPPLTGGIAQLLHNIALGFHKKGYQVLAVAPRFRGLVHNDHELPYSIRRIPLIRGFFETAALLIILRHWLKNRDTTVVCGTWVAGGLPLMLLKILIGLKYVIVVYGMDILHSELTTNLLTRRPRAYYMRKSLGLADQIWAISNYTGKIVESYSIDQKNILIFPLPLREDLEMIVRGDRRINVEPHPGKTVIMTVGKLVQYKGQDQIIRLLQRLRQRFGDVEYHIVGDGPDEEYLKKLVKDNGVEEHVRFLGSVPNSKLPELYATCDVFVMVSRENLKKGFLEGFGLVYLEANALGKPVVAGKSGGVPDAVEHGVSGLLADPEDLDDIYEKLSSLIENPEYAKKLGEQGRERVLNHFLVDHMMQTLVDYLNKAADS